ncbi:ABC transporter ATP-binding protein [Fusibacter sp. JL216-2]|uniref:ABC transporter ATP-binding protein n=1 Tax=Fusibacter sp. JL216-2 TaxID=3071453 RepID=UPI003D3430B2
MYPVEVKNLSHAYDTTPILKGINLKIEKGSFSGIVGPNGSGKTTLVKNIMRSISPHKKTVFLSGMDVRSMTQKDLAKVLGAVPQSNVIEYDFTAEEIVLMGRAPHIGRFQRESNRDYAIAEEAMKKTDTWQYKDRSVKELSGGERQRVIIARALAQQPDILILDEPVTHLDIRHQIALMELTRTLCKDKGITVVAILHDLNFAMTYCDHVILVHKGEIVESGKPDRILTEENIRGVYGIDVCIVDHPKTGAPYILTI